MKLMRAPYGKRGTPAGLREFQVDGKGPVGTIVEFCKLYPNEKFDIIDNTNIAPILDRTKRS